MCQEAFEFGSAVSSVAAAPAGKPIDPGRLVRIELVDSSGAGVAGARVHLDFSRRGRASNFSRPLQRVGTQTLVTDEHGRAKTLAPQTASSVEIQCDPPAQYMRPCRRNIEARNGNWAAVRFRLTFALAIHGTVARANGSIVQNCTVRAQWRGDTAFDCRTGTDDDGRFRLRIPENAERVTVVVSPGQQRFSRWSVLQLAMPWEPQLASIDSALAEARIPDVVAGAYLRVVLLGGIETTVRGVDQEGRSIRSGVIIVHTALTKNSVDAVPIRRVPRFRGPSTFLLAPGTYHFEFHADDANLAPGTRTVVVPQTSAIVLRCKTRATCASTVLEGDAD